MLPFEAGTIVLAIPQVEHVLKKEFGWFGVIKKSNPDMGIFASRFALNQAGLLIPNNFRSITDTGNTLADIFLLAFGIEGAKCVLPAGHILVNPVKLRTIASMTDEAILALVQEANS